MSNSCRTRVELMSNSCRTHVEVQNKKFGVHIRFSESSYSKTYRLLFFFNFGDDHALPPAMLAPNDHALPCPTHASLPATVSCLRPCLAPGDHASPSQRLCLAPEALPTNVPFPWRLCRAPGDRPWPPTVPCTQRPCLASNVRVRITRTKFKHAKFGKFSGT